jgi:hypothetical protein
MSANATNASAAPGDVPAPEGPSLYERAEQVAARVEKGATEVWHFFRFVLFLLFLLLLTVAFWLWVFSLILALVRFVLHAVAWVALMLSGGLPPRPGPATGFAEGLQIDLKRLWARRTVVYEDLSRPLARHLVGAQYVGRMFWHWSWFHKGFTVLTLFLTIFVPGLYVIPRAHDVQITDDNAVAYDKNKNVTTYLVHALDLDVPGKTREYINEEAWYLGKINPQGLKSQLQNGRTYRLWVVGVRWYYLPTLYPNIIAATEIDEHRNTVSTPRRLPAPAQAPASQ